MNPLADRILRDLIERLDNASWARVLAIMSRRPHPEQQIQHAVLRTEFHDI